MQIKLNKIENKWWGSSSSSSVTFWNALFLAWLWIGVVDVGFGLRRVDAAAVQTNNSVLGSSSPMEETSGTGTGTRSSPPPVPVQIQIQSGSSSDHANKRDHAGSGRSFTPSISELSVPFRDNPKIILGNFPGNSVVLPLLNGEVSASNYLVHLARQAGNSDPGYFIVEAPKNYGVMAVIQQLHLGRISDSKSLLQLVNNCKDYVLFEGHNGEKTIPICGTLEKGDNSFYPANLHGPKFFNSPNGRIKVTFRNHYSYGNDLVSQNESDEQQNQEMIMVEIAFTAYSNCTTADEAKGKFQCTLEKCIDSQLACDKTVNCAPGENQSRFGVDETNCTRSNPTPHPTGTGTGTETGASKTARPEPRNHANHDPADHNPHHENSQIAHNRNNNGKYHQHHHHLQLQQQLQGRRFEIQVGKEEEDEEDSNLSTFLDDDELLPVSIFNQPKNPISTKTIKSPTTTTTGSNSHNPNHHHHKNNENENNNLSSESSDDDNNNNTSPNNSDPNEDNSRLPNLTTIIILVIILALVTICGYFWSWVSQFLCAARSLLRSAEVGVVQQQQQQQSHVDNNNVSSSYNHNNSQGTGTGAEAGGLDHQQQQQHHPRLPIAYYVPAVVLRTTSSSHRNHHHHHNHINSIQAVNSLNNSAGDKKMSEADSPPPSYELLFPGPISGSGDSTKIASPVTVTKKKMHDMKE